MQVFSATAFSCALVNEGHANLHAKYPYLQNFSSRIELNQCSSEERVCCMQVSLVDMPDFRCVHSTGIKCNTGGVTLLRL